MIFVVTPSVIFTLTFLPCSVDLTTKLHSFSHGLAVFTVQFTSALAPAPSPTTSTEIAS